MGNGWIREERSPSNHTTDLGGRRGEAQKDENIVVITKYSESLSRDAERPACSSYVCRSIVGNGIQNAARNHFATLPELADEIDESIKQGSF